MAEQVTGQIIGSAETLLVNDDTFGADGRGSRRSRGFSAGRRERHGQRSKPAPSSTRTRRRTRGRERRWSRRSVHDHRTGTGTRRRRSFSGDADGYRRERCVDERRPAGGRRRQPGAAMRATATTATIRGSDRDDQLHAWRRRAGHRSRCRCSEHRADQARRHGGVDGLGSAHRNTLTGYGTSWARTWCSRSRVSVRSGQHRATSNSGDLHDDAECSRCKHL